MKGTRLPDDKGLYNRLDLASIGCSTRQLILAAAALLMNAAEDEINCKKISRAQKKRRKDLVLELGKLSQESAHDTELVYYTPIEIRERLWRRKSAEGVSPTDGAPSAIILKFPQLPRGELKM